MKPYYERDGITIYHYDAREVLPTLHAQDGTVVIMDPPYGINHESGHGASWENTTIANDHSTELRDWLIEQLFGLPMFVFGTWKAERPKDTRAVLIWDKGPAFGMGDLSFPWKNSFEEIYVIGDGFSGRRDEGVIRGHIVPSWETLGRRHQHEKPVSLMAYLLSKTPQATCVIDPCMGTGPTIRAAADAGLQAIGIEIEERYCEIAVRRLSQVVLSFGYREKMRAARRLEQGVLEFSE